MKRFSLKSMTPLLMVSVHHTDTTESHNIEIMFNLEDDWNIVVIEIKSLSSRWEQLVVYLGLPFDLIDNTIRPACNPWNEALKQWTKHNYDTTKFGLPSWRTLLKAVAQVNKRQCRKLAKKHRGLRP